MTSKMKIYLAGPINGCSDEECHGWRDKIKKELPEFEYLDPTDRDYRGVEGAIDASKIVSDDLAAINDCDLVIANPWKCSWGTAMEMWYTHNEDIPLYIVWPYDRSLSPWVWFCTTFKFDTVEDLIEYLKVM